MATAVKATNEALPPNGIKLLAAPVVVFPLFAGAAFEVSVAGRVVGIMSSGIVVVGMAADLAMIEEGDKYGAVVLKICWGMVLPVDVLAFLVSVMVVLVS